MLLNEEVVIGDIYAWDTHITLPDLGCNVFTIIKKEKDNLVTIESLDGYLRRTVGLHCLMTVEVAFKRLELLRKIEVPENSKEKWSYDRELNYLTLFEEAYNKICVNNTEEQIIDNK